VKGRVHFARMEGLHPEERWVKLLGACIKAWDGSDLQPIRVALSVLAGLTGQLRKTQVGLLAQRMKEWGLTE
jgi:hypothetical protein